MLKFASMKKQAAIDLAGSATALAEILGISIGAVSQWGDDIPDARMWQLKVLRPDWFQRDAEATKPTEAQS